MGEGREGGGRAGDGRGGGGGGGDGRGGGKGETGETLLRQRVMDATVAAFASSAPYYNEF